MTWALRPADVNGILRAGCFTDARGAPYWGVTYRWAARKALLIVVEPRMVRSRAGIGRNGRADGISVARGVQARAAVLRNTTLP